jgi:hypothetical protein
MRTTHDNHQHTEQLRPIYRTQKSCQSGEFIFPEIIEYDGFYDIIAMTYVFGACYRSKYGDCMAIEFDCVKCRTLLSVGEEYAGRNVQCPKCQTVMQIPSAPVPDLAPPPPLSSFQSQNPYAAPQTTQFDVGVSAANLVPTKIEVGDTMRAAWKVFKNRWADVLVGLIVMGVVQQGISFVAQTILQILQLVPKQEPKTQAEVTAALIYLFIHFIVTMCISAWVTAGINIYFLKICRGEATTVGDLFSGFPYYLPVLLTTLAVTAISIVGYVCFIIPGIIAILMFLTATYIVVDRNVGVADALQLSRSITSGNKFTIFLIFLVTLLILIASIITIIGAIVVGLFSTVLIPVLYLKMSGQPVAYQDQV